MVLRVILQYLSNNEHLVQKLSESYPIRRAAQYFVNFYYRGQSIAEKQKVLSPTFFRKFFRSLSNNFKEELENAKKELGNRKK